MGIDVKLVNSDNLEDWEKLINEKNILDKDFENKITYTLLIDKDIKDKLDYNNLEYSTLDDNYF